MWQSLARIIIHRLVLMTFAFIAAKYVFAADTLNKLMTGDTITLWEGSPKVSLADIENYLLLVIVPVIASVVLAFWQRIKTKYALMVARLSPGQISEAQVKAIVQDTPRKEIFQTVMSSDAPAVAVEMNAPKIRSTVTPTKGKRIK